MTQEGGTPPGFWDRVEQIAERVVARYARSGPLQNASISDGGLTIKGGFLKVVASMLGVNLLYVGPMSPNQVDGSPQQGLVIRRADGTVALSLYDAFPGADGLKQALNWFDRSGQVILADDTESGGLARPWVPFVAYPSNSADWPTTTSTTFVTKHTAKGPKQQPKLWVETWVNAPTSGAVAEVRVLVNGTELAPPKQSTPGFVSGLNFGPAAVAGAQMSTLTIEVQARLASGTGTVEVGLGRIEGRQT